MNSCKGLFQELAQCLARSDCILVRSSPKQSRMHLVTTFKRTRGLNISLPRYEFLAAL